MRVHEQVLTTIAGINTIVIENTSSTEFSMPAGTVLADCSAIHNDHESDTANVISDADLTDKEKTGLMTPLMGKETSYDLRQQLQASNFPSSLQDEFIRFVNEKVPSVFSKNSSDIGTAKTNDKMDIELDTTEPIFSRPYKLDYLRQEQLDKEMDRLCELGIFERGDSRFAAPAFIIGKKLILKATKPCAQYVITEN